MNVLKGFFAVFAGLVASVILTLSVDGLLRSLNILDFENFHSNNTVSIIIVLLYRFIFNIFGCYIAALMAPKRPQLHAMILAVAGLLFSLLGAVEMWQYAPIYYNVGLLVLALPAGIVGARIYMYKFNS